MADPRSFRLAPILLEASFVVLGVFLALVANEWRADANARTHATSARATVIEEIRSNRAALAASHDYHEGLLDTLRSGFSLGGPPPNPSVFSEGFVRPATSLSTAWDAAGATDALSHMDYDEVLAFSKLYALQQRYERTSEGVGSVIFAEIFERGVPGVAENYRNLSYIIASLLYREHELLDEYDRVLTQLDGVTG